MSRIIYCLVSLVAVLAASPGKTQEQQTVPSSSALSAEVPATSAELYIFNDSGRTLIPSNQVVTDNGRPVASLPRQTYVKLVLAPGLHLLKPEPPLWKQAVSLNAVPGSRYFVVVAYRPERSWAMPYAGAPLLLREITEEQASPLLAEMKAQ